MANELTNITSQSLSVQEQTELEGQIDALIAQYKGNAYEINSLAFNGAMILTATDKHAKEKAAQGFFKRLGKNLTCKNNRTQNVINKDLAKAQYIAQKILVKLAEQQQLTFELIAAVHSKLNSAKLEIDRELNDVYGTLVNHDERIGTLEQKVSQLSRETADKINGIYGHLLKVDVDIKKLNQNMNLVNWVLTIKNQTYCGIKYSNLDAATKIVCVVRDFFALMQGRLGTINDLNLLENALEQLGLETIIREKFIRQVGTNTRLYTHLLGEDSRLGDFATENEEIICDIQRTNDIEINCRRKFFPEIPSKVAVNNFVLELLYDIKQLDLAKERSDAAEKLFLDGYIDEALPLLKETTNNGNINKRRYMFAIVCREGMTDDGKNPDYVKELLTANISAGDVCSIFLGARIGFVPKETAADNFPVITKLADGGDIFAQYELARYFHEDSGNVEKYLKLAADKNYFLAAYKLGKMYYFGRNGVSEDNKQARKYFELAAKSRQHEHAMFYLGDIYWYGLDVTVDKKKAVEFYKKVYGRGSSSDKMINHIANFYYDVEKNPAEAIKWWRIGAEKNYSMCLMHLGIQYRYGVNAEKNWSEAVKYFERAIATGASSGFSEQHLGNIYWEGGNGITADKKKSAAFYKQAYERGKSSDDSINNIANFYDDVEKNSSEAVKWWRIGAEKNYPLCLSNLGWAYRNGHGVEKNWSEAVKYFEREVEAGASSGFSEQHLGSIYSEGGYGVTKDCEKAVEFYEKTIAKGRKLSDSDKKNFANALFETGGDYYHIWNGKTEDYGKALKFFEKAYDNGRNDGDCAWRIGRCNYQLERYYTALDWFKRGAEKGDFSAARYAGECYREGKGTYKDYWEAYTYFKKAIELGGSRTGYIEWYIAKIALEASRKYPNGLYGLQADRGTAIYWFKKAADKGDEDA